jgi:hypothetical protein
VLWIEARRWGTLTVYSTVTPAPKFSCIESITPTAKKTND